VADECVLMAASVKMKGRRCGVGSLGKRKVVGRCFALSSSERGRASDSGAWHDGARSSAGASWCPEEWENPEWATLGWSGPHWPGTQVGADEFQWKMSWAGQVELGQK
jgi:hypothetical protein